MSPERTRTANGATLAQGVTPGLRASKTPHAPDWDDDLNEIPTRLTP